jgi:hypothetical protein
MGIIKGQKEYQKFLDDGKLTHKEAILANCYFCNGLEDSRSDCEAYDCPLYRFSPYNGSKKPQRAKNTVYST